MPTVTAIELLEDRTARSRCDEGFLRLKRLTAQNRRADGSTSRTYPIDLIDRPALDAVAVVIWARTERGIEVLTRLQLRPAAGFRDPAKAVLPEAQSWFVEEVVAGVIEPGERGEAALRERARAEVHEEAGLQVEVASLRLLGGPLLMLPGIASEKIHLLEVEVPRGATPNEFTAPEEGDGSPLEEGSVLRWRELGAAIAACTAGELQDVKSEVGFRRLAERLQGRLEGRAP